MASQKSQPGAGGSSTVLKGLYVNDLILVNSTAQSLSMTSDPSLPERLRKSAAFFVEPSHQPYFERVRELLHKVGVHGSSPSPLAA
jgi:hypothetical protein